MLGALPTMQIAKRRISEKKRAGRRPAMAGGGMFPFISPLAGQFGFWAVQCQAFSHTSGLAPSSPVAGSPRAWAGRHRGGVLQHLYGHLHGVVNLA